MAISQMSFLLFAQLLLRTISLLLCISAIGLGIASPARAQGRWIPVFVAASVALLTSTIQLRNSLLTCAGLPNKRLPPWVFIICDIIAVALAGYALWSIGSQGNVGQGEGIRIAEIWVLVGIWYVGHFLYFATSL
ncbi:hypothetical protein EG329_010988 [Mollisiaceae sp. DMI_Dod_QoI]|nr:hypothetical protein EG329_010988 [Helotiales sp. DMI_Dod_QoI]